MWKKKNHCETWEVLFFFLLHTCVYSVYYTCGKPLLYQTGDPLSNTSGQNFFWHSPSLQTFWGFSYLFHITLSTTKINLKWILSKIYFNIYVFIYNIYDCSLLESKTNEQSQLCECWQTVLKSLNFFHFMW